MQRPSTLKLNQANISNESRKMNQSRQAEDIGAWLALRSSFSLRNWLAVLTVMLDAEDRLEADTVKALIELVKPLKANLNPPERQALLEFWSQLATRHPVPALSIAYTKLIGEFCSTAC